MNLKTIIQLLKHATEIDKNNLCKLLSNYLDCTTFNGLYLDVEKELYEDNGVSDKAKNGLIKYLWAIDTSGIIDVNTGELVVIN